MNVDEARLAKSLTASGYEASEETSTMRSKRAIRICIISVVSHQNKKVTKSLTVRVSDTYSSIKVTNERDKKWQDLI